ncbi:hypothetical protein BH23PLA1_BH23PLA1_24670 [soil metagenome]
MPPCLPRWPLAFLLLFFPSLAIGQCLDSPSSPRQAAPMDLEVEAVILPRPVVPNFQPVAFRNEAGLRFEVTIKEGLTERPIDGRLFVLLNRNPFPEPRQIADHTGDNALPMFARDVSGISSERPGIIDDTAEAFPLADLQALPPGEYTAQAVLDTNLDINDLNAPGNLYSNPVRFRLDPARGGIARLVLDQRIPAEELPADTAFVKYIKIRSDLLSKFHGRPIFLRAALIVPRDFDQAPDRRYPLRVHIGGFGARFNEAGRRMAEGSRFRPLWLEDNTPRMLFLHLDGAGPLGDPYQVNSANHGPYGDAITQELIPHVEQTYQGIGEPYARVLDGGSTGGWVALALQVFYPDFFNGAWAFCPDSVDFRDFQLINIYEDANAYKDPQGQEIPACREINGAVRYTMRHECQLENTLGRGDTWTTSGGQWGAWNATYSPRGPDGLPVPLWDPKTGAIDRPVAEHWKKYDLRLILETNWPELGPKLRDKLHIWVGEADNFFLERAVHRLDDFLKTADPPFEGTITFGPGQGHCWMGITEREMMDRMAARIEAGRQAVKVSPRD